MRGLDLFPLILFSGVWRPASIGSCDTQWLIRKDWSLAVCGCTCGVGHTASFQESAFPQVILRKLQEPPLLVGGHFKNLLLGRWYVEVGKAWAQDPERPEF